MASKAEIIAGTNTAVDELKLFIPKMLNSMGGFAAMEIGPAQNALMNHVADLESLVGKVAAAMEAVRSRQEATQQGAVDPIIVPGAKVPPGAEA